MEELDLKEIFRMFWNGKKIIIILTVFLVAITLIYSYLFQVPKYQSSTTLVLTMNESTDDTTSSVTTTDVTMNQKLVSTYSEIVKSKSILEKVIENLGIPNLTENELRSNVKVTAVSDTEVIKITVTNKNPEYAAKIANEIGSVFAEKIAEMYKINNVYVLDEAESTNTPYNVKPAKYSAIAFMIGIVLSCAIIIIINILDTTVKTAEEIEKALKVPVIAQIPYYDDTVKKGGKK